MFCKYCGKEIEDNSRFCAYCGQQQDIVSAPDPDALEKKNNSLSGEILKWGIMSLAFAQSFWLAFLGIVFYTKMKKKAAEYVKLFGELRGRASVGHGLGLAGLIVGIALTVLLALYLMFIILYGFIFAFIITGVLGYAIGF